jgi:cytochrome c553
MTRNLSTDHPLPVKRWSSSWIVPLAPLLVVLPLGIALKLSSLALAQADSPDQQTLYLSGNCTNCHGTQGRSAGAMPSLAGLSQSHIAERMRDFRDGKRPATIMHQIARGYTERQSELLAEYFARQMPER